MLYGLGFESHRRYNFLSILNYVCDIVVKRFTFAISHLLMSACHLIHQLTIQCSNDRAALARNTAPAASRPTAPALCENTADAVAFTYQHGFRLTLKFATDVTPSP